MNIRHRVRLRTNLCILLLLLAALLASCATRRTVPVSSLVYSLPEKLTEGKFDDEYAEKMNTASYKYSDRNIYLSVKNDALLLSDTDPTGGNNRSLAVSGGCFVGTDGGSTGAVGSVIFRADDGTVKPVINENCRALIALDSRSCLVVTCVYGSGENGARSSFYRMSAAADNSGWVRSLILSLDGAASAVCLAPDGSSVCAALSGEKNSLVKLTFDGKLTRMCESELLGKLDVTSIVYLRGKLYCSSKTGIFEFDPAGETEVWYPVDWRRLG